jgi:hypothetical protein
LPYNKKEEIIYDGKRYRKWNNYLTIGAGKGYSNVRVIDQSVIDVDYTFHLQKQYFQFGVLMSGDQFLSNNNLSAHFGYALRYEKNKYNLAAFAGPSYSYFVTASNDSLQLPVFHSALGGYVCLQAIYKFKYDLGIGGELFGDISNQQQMYGARLVLYFSGAYRGEKRGVRRK